jgi:hypothetical protein
MNSEFRQVQMAYESAHGKLGGFVFSVFMEMRRDMLAGNDNGVEGTQSVGSRKACAVGERDRERLCGPWLLECCSSFSTIPKFVIFGFFFYSFEELLVFGCSQN